MADRYWVGGTGNWNDTAKWSTTSGGASGASVPTAADNAYFDGSSDSGAAFTVTVNVASTCNDLIIGDVTTVTALDQVMTLAGSSTLAISGSLFFPATNLTRTYAGFITFNATTTGKNITTNGIGLTGSSLNFDGVGGEWILQGALSISGDVGVIRGTFRTNNFNVSAARFRSNNSNTRAIYFGSSTISVFATNNGPWDFITTTNLTLDAGTSTIQFTASSFNINLNEGWFNGGGLTYYNFELTSTALTSGPVINGANTFNNFTVVNQASASSFIVILFNANQTINGSLNIQSGNTAANKRIGFYTRMATPATITAAAINIGAGAEFSGIIAAGASSPWNFSSTAVSNAGNNTNITFPAAKTVYWNLSGTQNWNANAWATTRTGTPDPANFPLGQDTAVITEAGAAGTIVITAATYAHWAIGTLTFDDGVSARTSAVQLTLTGNLAIYGNLVLSSGFGYAGAGYLYFSGNVEQTINTATKTIGNLGVYTVSPGSLKLLANVTSVGTLVLGQGALNLNNFSFTAGAFTGTSATRSIAFGSQGKLVITGNNGFVVYDIQGGMTYTGTPRVELTYAGPTGTRSISCQVDLDYYVTAGLDIVKFGNSGLGMGPIGTLDLTGFSGTLDLGNSISVFRDFILSSNTTTASSGTVFTLTAANGTTRLLATKNVTVRFPLTINSATGTVVLDDNLTFQSDRALTVTSGTLNIGTRIVTVSSVTKSGGNITFSSGQIILQGTGTVWNHSGGTITPGTGKIVMSDNSNTARTFAGGGILTYPEVEIGGDTGTSTTTFTGANRFAKLTNTKLVAYTIVFPNVVTSIDNWNLNGSAGNLITLSRTGGSGTFTINYAGGQYIVAKYLSISNSVATPTNRVYAIYSTDGGGNTGWKFNEPKFGQFLSFFASPI